MPHYLLSVHAPASDDHDHDPPAPPPTAWFDAVDELEQALEDAGAWRFSGRLSDPGSATVVRDAGGSTVTTDGPFAESKEHLAGFYIIDAADLDDALAWAGRVTTCIGSPIEVRPFLATGRVRRPDHTDH